MVKSSETERKEHMETSNLMEQILSSDNLNRAYLQVVQNKGAEGVDKMKYTELGEHLVKNGEIYATLSSDEFNFAHKKAGTLSNLCFPN